MKRVSTFWPRSPIPGNMGDVWTPYLLSRMEFHPVWVHPSSSPKLLATGSIVRFAMPGDCIWGSGLIDSADRICTSSRYLCVRGPVTGGRCNCSVYGDPGLLAPLFIEPCPKRNSPVTVIPHYVHLDHSSLKDYDVVNPVTDDVHSKIEEVASTKTVISSSLHGIIFAHAYGIPAGWWRPDNALTGDDVKFRDYAESVNIRLKPSKTIEGVDLELPDADHIRQCQKNLMRTIDLWNIL